MKLSTKHFGEIDIEDSRKIIFEEGIPGFEDLKEYILLTEEENEENTDKMPKELFLWLQSVDDGEVSFVLIDTFLLMPEYNPKIEEETVESLGEYNPETFEVYNIITVPENINDMTVNLKAPIIINSTTNKGKQVVVLNEEYQVRHQILKEIKN